MANKQIFGSLTKWFGGKSGGQSAASAPKTDAVNEAGGRAYALTPHQALAQLAVTGALNGTYYADAQRQLDQVLAFAWKSDPEFVAKAAVYAFEKGHMKDMPALLLAMLSQVQGDQFNRAFPRIVRNGKMLRNLVQILRSGAVGRKSLGSRPKRFLQAWLEQASTTQLLQASIGAAPSLGDVIKMVHPKPQSPDREALYGYFIGRPHDQALLPQELRDYEAFKRDMSLPMPEVPFQMLTSLPLEQAHWRLIAERGSWQMIRQNLNAFQRRGLFEDADFLRQIAARLRDPDEIRRARLMPYQLMAAWMNVDPKAPKAIREALEAAMEVALANAPKVEGHVAICVDVSGSMSSPVTGWRPGATTVMRCVDVAALIAAAILRQNRSASVIPFNHAVQRIDLDPRASVMKNAGRLGRMLGGGTDLGAPLRELALRDAPVDLVVVVSDNQSWIDAHSAQATDLTHLWGVVKRRSPAAKMVCIDLQPYATTQAKTSSDVLNVGGFSDQVFEIIADMAQSTGEPDLWVSRIEAVML